MGNCGAECNLKGPCNEYNHSQENCPFYIPEKLVIEKKKMEFKEQVQKCYDYLDFIEDFCDKYDEEVGLDYDYDEGITILRDCLHQMIKDIR